MVPKKNNLPRNKIAAIIAVIILTLLAAGFLGWSLIKGKFIKANVNSTVYKKTNGLYTVSYSKLVLDEVAGNLFISHLRITPDTTKFRQLAAGKINPPLLFAADIPELKITGVRTPAVLLGKKLNGRKLYIKNASAIIYYANGHPDSCKAPGQKELYRELLGNLKEIIVDTVELANISLALVDLTQNRTTAMASDISVQLRDVLVDSLHGWDSARFFFAKKGILSAGSATIKNTSGTYNYIFEGISFIKEEGLLSVKSIKIHPELSEEKFAAFSKWQKDRFDFTLKNIFLKNINPARLMESGIVADSLIIKESILKVFRDLSYPRDKLSRVGSYPHQLIMDLPMVISIKKIFASNAFIEYKEKNNKSNYSGRVVFTNAGAVISNVTNDPAALKTDQHCVVKFHARFLGMTPMQARITMRLNDKNGRFGFSGSMKGFEADKLNGLIRPLAMAEIEKGNVHKLLFDFNGHNYGSDGSVTLLYNDLKISLLKKEETGNELKKKKLASFAVNAILKKANPSGKQTVRVAEVHYDRDTNRSFFNLMWKSIFTGIKRSAGI